MTTPDPAFPSTLPWLDALPDPGLLVTPGADGQVQYANPAAARHFGISRQTLLGLALAQLWPELADQLTDPHPLPRTFRLRTTGVWDWVEVRAFTVGARVALQLSDATAQQAADIRGGALFDLTVALSRALTVPEAAEVVLRQVLAALDATTGSVFVLDDRHEELIMAGSVGYDAAYMQGWQRFPVSAPTLLGDALRAGAGLFLSTAEVDARYPHLRVQRRQPTRTVAALPLLFGGQAVGVMSFGFAHDQPLTIPERQFLLAVTEQLAQALERARLLGEEQRARDRAALLYEVTAALGGATTPEEVARVVGRLSTTALGATGGAVLLLDAGRDDLTLVDQSGFGEARAADWRRLGAQLIGPEAARSAQALFIGPPESLERDPHLRHPTLTQASAALPLWAGGELIGVLTYGWDEPHTFDPAQQALLLAIAGQCGQALGRTLLAQEEGRARERALRLARAGELLAGTRDPQGVLDELVGLVVPTLADWCNVALPDGQGQLALRAAAHPDPETLRMILRVRGRIPVSVDGDSPLAQVFRTGEGRLMPVLADVAPLLPEGEQDPEFAAAARAGNARSVIVVPLTARGAVLGVLSLISGTPGRFGPQDFAFAQDLARRAAAALDGARLYGAMIASGERYRALIEATNQYVWTNSPQGEMVGEQPGWARLTGQSEQDYQGYGWAARLHPDDQEPAVDAWRASVRTRSLYEVEQRVQVGDGSYRSFLVRAVPLLGEDGALREWVGMHSDVTDLKLAELTLKAWNSELERQVAAQTRELRAANEELGAFAYTVSHDLRAPVRHVASFAGLLRAKVGDDPGVLRYVDVIEGAASRMDTLIDALLGLARAGMAELRLTDVNLKLLVDAVKTDLTAERAGPAVVWRVSELPVVRADPDLLRQVLANLLGNALKYSRRREDAVVEIWAEETESGVTIAVRDNGAGFDPQYAGQLFGVFQRLHHPKEFEGTGVGLANVKRIVEKHGGRVWAQGRPGEGATFYFSLPGA